jgi:hypothetical protein
MTWLHIGVVLGAPDAPSCWSAVEIVERAPELPSGPWNEKILIAGPYEEVESDIHVMRERLLKLLKETWSADPLVWIDCVTPTGLALWQAMKQAPYPEGLRRPYGEALRGKSRGQYLLAPILLAQAEGRLEFETKRGTKSALVEAIKQHSAVIGDDGRLSQKDKADAALSALGLACCRMVGHLQPPTYRNRDGTSGYSRETSGDPYFSGVTR